MLSLIDRRSRDFLHSGDKHLIQHRALSDCTTTKGRRWRPISNNVWCGTRTQRSSSGMGRTHLLSSTKNSARHEKWSRSTYYSKRFSRTTRQHNSQLVDRMPRLSALRHSCVGRIRPKHSDLETWALSIVCDYTRNPILTKWHRVQRGFPRSLHSTTCLCAVFTSTIFSDACSSGQEMTQTLSSDALYRTVPT